MTRAYLKSKITAALERACLPNRAEIHLEMDNRIHGSVISHRFARLSSYARQELIWKYLDESLFDHERSKISFIAADTPEEHKLLMENR